MTFGDITHDATEKTLIFIHTAKLRTICMEFDAACKLLAILIATNPTTEFWFGSTTGTMRGSLSLTIGDGQPLSFYSIVDKPKAYNPHDKFMLTVGNDLKKEFNI